MARTGKTQRSTAAQQPQAGTREKGGRQTRIALALEAWQRRWHAALARPWPALAALCLLVLVSYLPAMLWGDFIWDDLMMVGTPAVREATGLRQIWFSPGEIDAEVHYWPLVYSTFWLQHKLWGFAPAGYHVVNVLLHAASTLLLWRLLRRLAVPGAWIAAAVFAVHPVHVESVAWVIELKDVLSGLFYLSAALVWIRFEAKPRPSPYVATLALYVAGMLAKSVVMTLPVALLIRQWWQRGRVTPTDLLRLAPFFLVGAGIMVGDMAFNRAQGVGGFDYSMIERALIAARAVWFYLGKLFWPLDVGGIYPHWEVTAGDPWGWAALVAAGGLVTALWLLRKRFGRGPLAGMLFFGVTLAPTLGFVDYNFMLFSFVADRYQYLACFGVIAVVIGVAVSAVSAAGDTRRAWDIALNGALVASLIAVLGTLTWQQASLYRDGITFFNYVIARNPHARYAHLNLGNALLKWNHLEESLEPYRVAMEQLPDDYKPHFGAGLALYGLNRLDEAAQAFGSALKLNPFHGRSHAGLGRVRLAQMRYEEALGLTQTAIKLDPRNAEGWTYQGIALHHLGRTEEALESLDRAIAIDPNMQDAHDARTQVLEDSLEVRAHARGA